MSDLLQPARRWPVLLVWLLLYGSLLSLSGCLSYKAELVSSDSKTPGEVLDDSSDLTDPSDVDDNPTEPSSPSEPDDESDDPFDSWEADPDFVFDECAYQCTSEGPICDYESCDECTGCCPCDLGDRESVCTEEPQSRPLLCGRLLQTPRMPPLTRSTVKLSRGRLMRAMLAPVANLANLIVIFLVNETGSLSAMKTSV